MFLSWTTAYGASKFDTIKLNKIREKYVVNVSKRNN